VWGSRGLHPPVSESTCLHLCATSKASRSASQRGVLQPRGCSELKPPQHEQLGVPLGYWAGVTLLPALACSHLALPLPCHGQEERGRCSGDAGGCSNTPAQGRTLPGESRGGPALRGEAPGLRGPSGAGMGSKHGCSPLGFCTLGLVPTVPA